MTPFVELIKAVIGTSFLPREVNTQTDTPVVQIVRSAIGLQGLHPRWHGGKSN